MSYTASFLHRLHGALLAAFTRDDLRRLAALCLDADFDAVTAEKGLADQAFEFVQWAKRQGRVEDLVVCAQEAQPNSRELAALRRELQGPQMAWGADSVITDQGMDSKKLIDRLAARLDDPGAVQRLTDDELNVLRGRADARIQRGMDVQNGDQGVWQQYLDLFAAEDKDDGDIPDSERDDSQADA